MIAGDNHFSDEREHAWAAVRDALRAIVAFLRSVAPVRFQVPARVGPGEKPSASYFAVVTPQ